MHKDTTIPAAEPFTEEQIQRWRRLQREKAERESIFPIWRKQDVKGCEKVLKKV